MSFRVRSTSKQSKKLLRIKSSFKEKIVKSLCYSRCPMDHNSAEVPSEVLPDLLATLTSWSYLMVHSTPIHSASGVAERDWDWDKHLGNSISLWFCFCCRIIYLIKSRLFGRGGVERLEMRPFESNVDFDTRLENSRMNEIWKAINSPAKQSIYQQCHRCFSNQIFPS